MSFRTLPERIDEAVTTLSGLLRRQPLRVAVSGGKDSSVCLVLIMRAAEALVESGERPMPIIISSSDTMVENPEVSNLLRSLHESAKRYGEQLGVEVIAEIVRPNLLEQWWPRMLAGRKLPSYIGAQGDCSVDLKITPQRRLASRIDRMLAERGLPGSITVVGTRREESARRAANMASRGEQADAVVDGVIAPIADWSTDDVMVTLIDRDIDRFPHDYRSILNFYGDSAAGECIVTPEHRMGAAQGGCSSRSGCFTCQRVGDDKSLAALVSTDRYDYLGPLLRLNRYLKSIRWDLRRRSWLGRDIDPATGCVRLTPNCFSFDECDRLLRMVLSIDCEEMERAAGVAAALERGEIEDDARNRRLARPQFCNIDESAIVAIDFMRGVDCFGPAHSALAAWRDVYVLGRRYPVPEIEVADRPDALPEPRYYRLPALPAHGLFDPLLSMVAERNHGLTDDDLGDFFDVDSAAAAAFLSWELEACVAEGKMARSASAAALRLIRLGVIAIAKGSEKVLDRHMMRAQAYFDAGLRPAPMLPIDPTLSEAEHQDEIWQAALDAGVVGENESRPSSFGGWRRLSLKAAKVQDPEPAAGPGSESPAVLAERIIGLSCAHAAGVSYFDGTDVKAALRRARSDLTSQVESEATRDGLLASAWRRAERFVNGLPIGDDACGLLPWVALGEESLARVMPESVAQLDLFSQAA
jgi:3'-phosphoadenosine 5'-phosphosulfate sulfotransferase (PAPS reductase)/FAD synthetase